MHLRKSKCTALVRLWIDSRRADGFINCVLNRVYYLRLILSRINGPIMELNQLQLGLEIVVMGKSLCAERIHSYQLETADDHVST